MLIGVGVPTSTAIGAPCGTTGAFALGVCMWLLRPRCAGGYRQAAGYARGLRLSRDIRRPPGAAAAPGGRPPECRPEDSGEGQGIRERREPVAKPPPFVGM